MFDSDSDSEPIPLLPEEPADFRPAPAAATTATHRLTTSPHETLTVHLVGHNSLWGHKLWHAARVMSGYLETHATRLVESRTVLELGAAGALPSLVCALRGAKKVVATDYPDAPLLDTIRQNITDAKVSHVVTAEPYLWGNPLFSVFSHLPSISISGEDSSSAFDTVLLSDLVFNHSEHAKLAWTVAETLKRCKNSRALVFFTPHRPWLLDRDLEFFAALDKRLEVSQVATVMMDNPMFEEDTGVGFLISSVKGRR
jgi:nicotinamide N-methyltransferase